ncbi:MAG TPA: hypothetical protein VL974_11450 [Magnetospirillum sp.]|jgi:hypothetical protein|nr:hypothetical protein [Magnetospirillum sp.]
MRDLLERRYDGPIPPADPAQVPVQAGLRARLFQRLAGDTRLQLAGRRGRLRARTAVADAGLARLSGDLNSYRALGLAWLRP